MSWSMSPRTTCSPLAERTCSVTPGTPTVTDISPAGGPQTNGDLVVITGTDLTGASVSFGGNNAPVAINTNSNTSVTVSPPNSAVFGLVDVVITTNSGVSTGGPQYRYLDVPTVTAVNPTAGPLVTVSSVTVTGTDLTTASAVIFGSVEVTTGIVVTDNEHLTVVLPDRTVPGFVDVTVRTSAGTSEAQGEENDYTYVGVPTVDALDPPSGPLAGGGSLVITGTGLTGASAVVIDGANAPITAHTSDTSITVTIPAGTTEGQFDVLVTAPGGTSSGGTQYEYLPLPTVTNVDPIAGPLAGNTSVTVTRVRVRRRPHLRQVRRRRSRNGRCRCHQ